MSTPITTQPPAGSDGVVPLWPKNQTWKIWNISELYMGPLTPGTNHYIPNVGDWAVDTTLDQFYKVTAIDPTTFISTLLQIQAAVPVDNFSNTDRLISPGPGPRPNTFIMYANRSVKPTVARIDGRLSMYGQDVTSFIIALGSEIDGTQKIISAVYDQSGTLIGQEVAMELVDGTSGKMAPMPFNLTENVDNGTVVTAIFLSSAGVTASQSQLRVWNTAFVGELDQGTKYITSIGLATPFLSSADPSKILYPLNVPLRGLNLMGMVNYSDGSSVELPVDGTKFQLFGFNTGFVATVIGQQVPLVLKYNLSSDEVAMGVSVNQGNFLTKEFTAITIDADGQFTVKLFAYPIWVDAVNGYRLRWFMFNLDRDLWYDVTANVSYLTGYSPTTYGVQQKIQVQLNLQSVNGTFKNYTFTQTLWLTLLDQGTERTTNWTIAFTPGQTPQFGPNNYAATTFINQNLWKVNLAMGETDLDVWLQRTYYATQPLYDTQQESGPLVPDHFSLLIGDTEVAFPISQWNQDLTVTQALPDSGTLFVRFYQQTSDNQLQLAIAGFPCYQQN